MASARSTGTKKFPISGLAEDQSGLFMFYLDQIDEIKDYTLTREFVSVTPRHPETDLDDLVCEALLHALDLDLHIDPLVDNDLGFVSPEGDLCIVQLMDVHMDIPVTEMEEADLATTS